ncbi:hypothetical protein K432DRAFT_429307 [Lepidopterella palustris CBS 459.81]|uniref:GST N-terminal domain-containing protein n=1 Tax=Lepidopterella palustris CBS 459.81 TaxID=1314670 RepID=A0A8E2E1N5_9PEZI|nr:hypothetical protein K432DRAFT_429307 [Lepidopterella palustris CBS 459.81]
MTSSTRPQLILFDYDFSPFAQKIHLLLACCALPFSRCEQPPLLPRPTLERLGITYRRIPVLAMGKDVYCDTTAIIEGVLGRLASGFPRTRAEKAYESFGRLLFNSSLGLVGKAPDEAIMKDRATIFPQLCRPDIHTLRPSALAELRANFTIVEKDFLSAGAWVGGVTMSLDDVHVGFVVRWILKRMQIEKVPGFGKDEFPKIYHWVEQLPKSTPTEISQEDAVKNILSSSYAVGLPKWDDNDHLGIEEGAVVTVESSDATPGAHPQAGKLVGVSMKEVVLELDNSVRLHFPRQGYIVRKA